MSAPKLDYKAYCDSEKCAFILKDWGKGKKCNKYTYTGVKIKNVVKTTTFCPDCNAALYWSATPPIERVRK